MSQNDQTLTEDENPTLLLEVQGAVLKVVDYQGDTFVHVYTLGNSVMFTMSKEQRQALAERLI